MKKIYYVYVILQDVGCDPREEQIASVDGKAAARVLIRSIADALCDTETSRIAGLFFVNGENKEHESIKVIPGGYDGAEENGVMY